MCPETSRAGRGRARESSDDDIDLAHYDSRGCAPREREGSGADRIRRIGPHPDDRSARPADRGGSRGRQASRFLAQPGEDTSPFVFPTDGPRHQTRDFDRNYPLAMTLPGSDYYAVEPSAGNPSIMSHVNAGIIAEGGMTDYGTRHAEGRRGPAPLGPGRGRGVDDRGADSPGAESPDPAGAQAGTSLDRERVPLREVGAEIDDTIPAAVERP